MIIEGLGIEIDVKPKDADKRHLRLHVVVDERKWDRKRIGKVFVDGAEAVEIRIRHLSNHQMYTATWRHYYLAFGEGQVHCGLKEIGHVALKASKIKEQPHTISEFTAKNSDGEVKTFSLKVNACDEIEEEKTEVDGPERWGPRARAGTIALFTCIGNLREEATAANENSPMSTPGSKSQSYVPLGIHGRNSAFDLEIRRVPKDLQDFPKDLIQLAGSKTLFEKDPYADETDEGTAWNRDAAALKNKRNVTRMPAGTSPQDGTNSTITPTKATPQDPSKKKRYRRPKICKCEDHKRKALAVRQRRERRASASEDNDDKPMKRKSTSSTPAAPRTSDVDEPVTCSHCRGKKFKTKEARDEWLRKNPVEEVDSDEEDIHDDSPEDGEIITVATPSRRKVQDEDDDEIFSNPYFPDKQEVEQVRSGSPSTQILDRAASDASALVDSPAQHSPKQVETQERRAAMAPSPESADVASQAPMDKHGELRPDTASVQAAKAGAEESQTQEESAGTQQQEPDVSTLPNEPENQVEVVDAGPQMKSASQNHTQAGATSDELPAERTSSVQPRQTPVSTDVEATPSTERQDNVVEPSLKEEVVKITEVEGQHEEGKVSQPDVQITNRSKPANPQTQQVDKATLKRRGLFIDEDQDNEAARASARTEGASYIFNGRSPAPSQTTSFSPTSTLSSSLPGMRPEQASARQPSQSSLALSPNLAEAAYGTPAPSMPTPTAGSASTSTAHDDDDDDVDEQLRQVEQQQQNALKENRRIQLEVAQFNIEQELSGIASKKEALLWRKKEKEAERERQRKRMKLEHSS